MAKTMTLTYVGQTGWPELDRARTKEGRKAQIRALTSDTLGHKRFKVVSVNPTGQGPQGERTYAVAFEAAPSVINAIAEILDGRTAVTVDGRRWVAHDFTNWYLAGMPMRRGQPVSEED